MGTVPSQLRERVTQDVTRVNVLVIGPPGSGKSSLVCSTARVCQNDPSAFNCGAEIGGGIAFTTRYYRSYPIVGNVLQFFDTRGYMYEGQQDQAILTSLLHGAQSEQYLESTAVLQPNPNNRIDVVIIVVDAISQLNPSREQTYWISPNDVRPNACAHFPELIRICYEHTHIFPLVVVTKLDKSACNIQLPAVRRYFDTLAIPSGNVFGIKNYQSVHERDMPVTDNAILELLDVIQRRISNLRRNQH